MLSQLPYDRSKIQEILGEVGQDAWLQLQQLTADEGPDTNATAETAAALPAAFCCAQLIFQATLHKLRQSGSVYQDRLIDDAQKMVFSVTHETLRGYGWEAEPLTKICDSLKKHNFVSEIAYWEAEMLLNHAGCPQAVLRARAAKLIDWAEIEAEALISRLRADQARERPPIQSGLSFAPAQPLATEPSPQTHPEEDTKQTAEKPARRPRGKPRLPS